MSSEESLTHREAKLAFEIHLHNDSLQLLSKLSPPKSEEKDTRHSVNNNIALLSIIQQATVTVTKKDVFHILAQ